MKNTLLPTFVALLLFFGAEAQAPHSDSIRLHTDSARLQNDSAKLTDTAKAGAAGFKTVLLLACSLGGIPVGSGGCYAVNRLFHLHIASRTVLFTGAGGGLLAGLLLGLIAFALIRAVLSALKQRLAF